MLIEYIEVCGFGSYETLSHWDVPQGIIGIVGEYDENVKKSNGSGKTTMVDAIKYALYGEGECNKLEELVNDKVKQQKGSMFTKLSFFINGVHYLVERGITKKGSYLDFFENNVRRGDETTTIAETQESINKVLCMDYNMLSASNFFEQGKMDKFVNTEPGIRRTYMDRVLDLTPWRDSYTRGNKVLNSLKDSFMKVADNINATQKTIADFEIRIKDKDAFVEKLAKAQLLKKTKEEEKKRYEEISHIVSQISFQKEMLASVTKKLNAFKNDITAQTTSLKQLKVKQQKYIDAPANDSARIAYLNDTISEAKSKILTIDQQVKDTTSKEKEVAKNISEKETEIKFLSTDIIDVTSGVCPKCKTVVDGEHIKSENNKTFTKIDKLKEELALLKKESDSISISLKTAAKNKSTAEQSITTYVEEVDQINRAKHKEELDKLAIEKDISSLESSIASLEVSLKSCELEITKINSEIETYLTQISEEDSKVDVTLINKELTQVSEDIITYNKTLAGFSVLETEKIKAEKILEEYKTNFKNLEEQIFFKSIEVRLFKDIPTSLFEESVVDIENSANDIVQQILPNLQIKIWEDLQKKNRPLMISFIVDGFERSYQRLSGGERTVANIAIRLGFSQVITAKANTNINFIVLDEPFGALDEENRDLIKKVFAVMSQWFEQIIIISHDDSIENFPNILKIGKTEDGSSYIIA